MPCNNNVILADVMIGKDGKVVLVQYWCNHYVMISKNDSCNNR